MSTLNPASTWLSLSAEVAARQMFLRSLARRRRIETDEPTPAARASTAAARCAPVATAA
ncbi:MAG TPA: hypothetical protein VHE83_10515 [Mycobacteriales bacterium]|nr:hypothetical protein [Mycobacteriales bacterium]